MFADSRYVDRIPQIRDELVKCATFRETTSYTRLGKIVGIPTRGPWRGVLDQISREEIAEDRPDITHLIINKRTGFSSRIEHRNAAKPTDEQRQRSKQIQQDSYDYYRTGPVIDRSVSLPQIAP